MNFCARYTNAETHVALFLGAMEKIFVETDGLLFATLKKNLLGSLGMDYDRLDLSRYDHHMTEIGAGSHNQKSEDYEEHFQALADLFEVVCSTCKDLEPVIYKRLADGWCSTDPMVRQAAIHMFPIVVSEGCFRELIVELGRRASFVDWSARDQLEKMLSGGNEEADFLRDISVVTAARGDLELACALIGRARKLRPGGPMIQQLDIELNRRLTCT